MELRLVLASLIDFKEDQFGSAINHRFVPEQYVKPKNSIQVICASAEMT